jgi:hypothetical protein
VSGFEVIAAAYLGKAGKPGFHSQPGTLQDRIPLDKEGTLWARTNKTHVALDDIYQLGKLVEASRAEELAKIRNSRVIFCSPDRAAVFFGIIDHCPEFQQRKKPAILSDPLLAKDNTAGRGYSDKCRYDKADRQDDDQC